MKRRSLLFGGAAFALAGTAAYGLSSQQSIAPQRLSKRIPLAFPPQIDARQSGEFSLNAQSGVSDFVPGAASKTIGFNQSYLGPVVRVAANGTTLAKVSNDLGFPVTSHWHGLIIPGDQDGGPHQLVRPGTTWSPELTIDQAPAMCWFHSHVDGETATQVYAGLAGVMILDDGKDGERGLPKDYGIDDLVLVIQDKRLNEAGQLVYSTSMQDRMGGFIGNTIMVNGQLDPVARVPKSVVRLRLLNASNASFQMLEFSDGRPFYIVATDSGYLGAPREVNSVLVTPGERVQVLVDFSDGNDPVLVTSMQTAMNANGFMGTLKRGTSIFAGKIPLLAFQTAQSLPAKIRQIPASLDGEVFTNNAKIAKTRNFRLEVGMGMMGQGMGINGKPFEISRIDAEVKVGTSERWVVSADMLAHPFHVHGVKFRVLSEGGNRPRVENQGWKDTVLITGETVIELEFTQIAKPEAPYMFHCHILEHEDAGMMGQFSVT